MKKMIFLPLYKLTMAAVNMETQVRLAGYQSRIADCMEHIMGLHVRHVQLQQQYEVARQRLNHESKIATATLGENVVIDDLPRDHPLRDAKCDVTFIDSRIDAVLRQWGLYQHTAQQLTRQRNMEQQYIEERAFEQRDFEQLESDNY